MYRLSFTGNITEEEFNQKCGRHEHWYHSYYFDNGYQVRGDYNIGADIADYDFPQSMTGMRVLDIGTGSGWFAIYFEQHGAEVFTVDARGHCDLDVYGRYYYPRAESEGREPDRFDSDGVPIYDSSMSTGFWIMKDILGSKVRFVNSRAYDIRQEMFGRRKFDLVFMGAILCHLRDPIGALMVARRVCDGELIATTPVVIGEPESEVEPRQYLPYTHLDPIAWWLPNEACYRHWFLAAGFRKVNIERSITLRGDVPYKDETGRIVNEDQTLRLARVHI